MASKGFCQNEEIGAVVITVERTNGETIDRALRRFLRRKFSYRELC